MRVEVFQFIVPLAFLAIWALTALLNRDAQQLPPRTTGGAAPDGFPQTGSMAGRAGKNASGPARYLGAADRTTGMADLKPGGALGGSRGPRPAGRWRWRRTSGQGRRWHRDHRERIPWGPGGLGVCGDVIAGKPGSIRQAGRPRPIERADRARPIPRTGQTACAFGSGQ